MPPKKKLTGAELAAIMKSYDPTKPRPVAKMLVLPNVAGANRIPTKTHKTPPKATGPVLSKLDRVKYLNLRANYISKLGGNERAANQKAMANIIAQKGLKAASPVPIKALKKSPVVLIGSPIKVFKSGTPKQRIRIGTRIAEGYTRNQLMNIYSKKGVHHGKYMTKRQLIDLVKGRAVTPVLNPVHHKTKMTRAEKLLVQVEKFKSLQTKTKKNIKEYANRHAIPGVSMSQVKAIMIAKIYAKLKKNVETVLATENKSKVTTRIILDRLIKEHGWSSNRNINKKYIQQVYMNSLNSPTKNKYREMYSNKTREAIKNMLKRQREENLKKVFKRPAIKKKA
jgi:hypothetical protein